MISPEIALCWLILLRPEGPPLGGLDLAPGRPLSLAERVSSPLCHGKMLQGVLEPGVGVHVPVKLAEPGLQTTRGVYVEYNILPNRMKPGG